MSFAVLLKLNHTSNKAFCTITKIPSYFQLCHLFILIGKFGGVYPVSPIYMLLSEISQEGSNLVSVLSNTAHQKSINLDFVNEQLTFFKHPKTSAETIYIDATVEAASKQPVSIAPSYSMWYHHQLWASLQQYHCTDDAASLLIPA